MYNQTSAIIAVILVAEEHVDVSSDGTIGDKTKHRKEKQATSKLCHITT